MLLKPNTIGTSIKHGSQGSPVESRSLHVPLNLVQDFAKIAAKRSPKLALVDATASRNMPVITIELRTSSGPLGVRSPPHSCALVLNTVCHTAAGSQHAVEYGGQFTDARWESSETRVGVSLRRRLWTALFCHVDGQRLLRPNRGEVVY
jgi:hypothetical protein